MYWIVWKQQQQQNNKKQQQKQKFLLIFYHLSILGWLNRAMLHSQYHRVRFILADSCWWPVSLRRQAISSDAMNPVLPALSSFSTRKVDITVATRVTLLRKLPIRRVTWHSHPTCHTCFYHHRLFDGLGFVQCVMFCCGISIILISKILATLFWNNFAYLQGEFEVDMSFRWQGKLLNLGTLMFP